ncbi:hypothetical protein FG386_000712 [Cryptosporidium ryanae]|uniref:uncharacterized protein n=1 Tax=Cryptosporidium ryanae TaxID=515981 RepID=UPI00351AA162|nr:hypothetical protein FG386_000712 [Cryptosporidium ryanae]
MSEFVESEISESVVRGRNIGRCPDEHCRAKSPSGKPGKSVEELCTCGKHTCPTPLKKSISFRAESSYNTDYKKWELPTHQKPDPVEIPKSLPFISESCYNQEYRKWELPIKEVRPTEKFVESPENRDFTTSYQTNYKKWDIKKVEIVKPPHEAIDNPNYGSSINSVYRENYQQWDLPEKRISEPEKYDPIKEDRNFGTAYRASFQGVMPSVCPVSLLPPIPNPPPGRTTMFWDSVSKNWY